jgi:hypothetical protein
MNKRTSYISNSGWIDARASNRSNLIERLEKLIFVLTVMTGLSLQAQQNGTVNFCNNSSTRLTIGQTGSPVSTNDHISAALYWAPTGSNGFVMIGAVLTNVGFPASGIFAGGTRTTGASTPGGSSAQFQVRAWSGGYSSYEQAAQHAGVLLGQSAVLTFSTGNLPGGPPTPPASLTAGGLAGFVLTPGSSSSLVLTCASNKIVDCSSTWSFDAPTATDTCANTNVTITVVSTITNGQCPKVLMRTWSATDSCGNSNMCSQVVTVADTTPPLLTCATNKTVDCASGWSFDPPTASDACSSNVTIIPVATVTNGQCPLLITRIWLATDPCGNSNACLQTVTVIDTTPPIISCVTNKTVNCASNWAFDQPSASDACGGAVAINVLSTTTAGVCPQVVTRTWAATDLCGNSNVCSQAITLIDTTPPSLACATNKTVDCSAAWTFDTPTASDSCSSNVSVTAVSTVTNGLCPQLITRTWVAADPCGNSNVCSQTVTVNCTNCVVLALTTACPANPVPPGGQLNYSGTVTNMANVSITNVSIVCDQPAPNTLVFGPVTLAPGEGAVFAGGYRVPPCACGPFAFTLIATGSTTDAASVSNSITTSCAGTNAYPVPGDLNGDGIVDQNELNAVLANYWAHSPWLYMTNPMSLGNGIFQFALTNASGWNFTVLVSTNLLDWTNLPGAAYPVYQFVDPDATNSPGRFYRLRYP